ncbi:hypothetical protein HRI_004001300 [Hibiscus trionum]|uniref:Polyprotein n=1 Tax=Hibiscus trionum TaxID=183268 RepID=A0A9W7IVH5_HIBTR|nr:hypothetical protein HRI_004001300 [Hibiscus trionum]
MVTPLTASPDTSSREDSSDQSFSNKRISVRLDETNFLLWKQQVLLMIRGHGLESFLASTAAPPSQFLPSTDSAAPPSLNPAYTRFVQQDSSLASWLLSTVSPEVLPRLVGADTSSKIWQLITGMYSQLSTTRLMHLHCRLRSIKKCDLSMRAYTMQIKEICDLLASCGSPVSSIEQIATILNGLPPEYDPFVAVISASRDPYTVDNAVSILIDAETRVADPLRMPIGIHNTQFYDDSRRRDSPMYSGGRFKGRPRVQCQVCGKLGHLADRCWHRFDREYKPNTAAAPKNPAPTQINTCYAPDHADVTYDPFVTTVAPELVAPASTTESPQINSLMATISPSSVTWFPDSGATHHVTNASGTLHSSQPYSGKGMVHVGDGSALAISSVGQSEFLTPTHRLKLSHLLLVPQITRNLLSVSKFTEDNNVFLEFHAHSCCVKDEATGSIILHGKQEGGLYTFTGVSDSSSALSCTVTPPSPYWLWHQRLGHPSKEVLQHTLNKQLVLDKHTICKACQAGKSHVLPFHDSTTVYSSAFDLVEIDLWGPTAENSNGFLYYISFVDLHTRHCWIYLLKRKSEASAAFNLFHALVRNHYNNTIKAIQTDGGSEFFFLDNLLPSLGIQRRITYPYTSQQNGVVERKHRHITEMALTLLAQASMPLKFWSYAVLTAVYIINRLPSKTLDHISPHQRLTSKVPDYSFLKVFGCECFPHLRPFQQHKLSFRSKPCLFLGYSPKHHGYQCVDDTGKIYITRNMVFNEHIFPFSSSSMPTSSNTISTPPFPHIPGSSITSPIPSPTTTPVPPPMPSSSTIPEAPATSPPENTSHDISSSIPLPEPSQPTTTTSADPIDPMQPSHTTGNTHTMLTRSKHGIFKPKIYHVQVHTTPTTVHEAFQDSAWSTAVHNEFTALTTNDTWDLVSLPLGKHAIGCKWIFRIKHNPDGTVNRFKARLVAKGYTQVPGCDFLETFSPVVRFPTINILLSLAVTYSWPLHHIDVNNAFLKGDLSEVVYMHQPPGFVQLDSEGVPLVCKLKKAIYGLRQAPRNWFEKLKHSLQTLGFQASQADSSLFLRNTSSTTLYIVVYVDDILLTGNSITDVQTVIDSLHAQFTIKDLSQLQFFLGLEVQRTNNGLFLHQHQYATDLLKKTGFLECKDTSTPMVIYPKLSKHIGEPLSDVQGFRSVVGALQYLCHTRPDLAYAVNKVAQYMQAPTDVHWHAVQRILRYIKTTLHFGLWFECQQPDSLLLTAFSDADWGSDIDNRRSTSSHCVLLGHHTIFWSARKQRAVSRSTAELEYRSLADTSAEVLWIRSVLTEMGIHLPDVPIIWCDNTSTVSMAANPTLHAKTKHVDLDLHFVREKVATGSLQVNYVPAHCQLADIFTKPSAVQHFEDLRRKLHVLPPATVSSSEEKRNDGNVEE